MNFLKVLIITVCTAAFMTTEGLTPSPQGERTLLMEGTSTETELVTIDADETGPTIFIIAGVHGDEIAGQIAAKQLTATVSLKKGRLVVIPIANSPGSRENSRFVEEYGDLNRVFPGKSDGDAAERLAQEIYTTIEQESPFLVLDLHEARIPNGNRDALGNSLIMTSMNSMEDLFPALLFATVSGEICSQPFTYFGPAPAGSLNRMVTESLDIPVITVETFREDPLEQRVDNHLDIIGYLLEYLNMI